MDDVRLVLQLLTPILLAFGIYILNSVSARISAIEATIKQFDRDCEERHKELWQEIRKGEKKLERVQGRMNGWFKGDG